MTTAEEVLEELYRYSREGLLPIVAAGIRIDLERHRSEAFNASVRLDPSGSYRIRVFDGCVERLTAAILTEKGETVSDTLSSLAAVLFSDPEHDDVQASLILHCAVMFVVLHEVSHVICGHFGYQVQHGLTEHADGGFQITETSTAPLADRATALVDPEWLKLIELEADEIAFDLLRAIGYEMLVAGDEFRARLQTSEEPDALPENVEDALGETMLCAAAAVCFLIDSERHYSPRYPLPETRIISLAHLLATKQALGNTQGGGPRGVTLDEATKQRLGKVLTAAVLNGVEFGIACAESRRAATTDSCEAKTKPREVVMTRDLLRIFAGEHDSLQSAGAREYVELQQRLAALRVELDGYRLGFLAGRRDRNA